MERVRSERYNREYLEERKVPKAWRTKDAWSKERREWNCRESVWQGEKVGREIGRGGREEKEKRGKRNSETKRAKD